LTTQVPALHPTTGAAGHGHRGAFVGWKSEPYCDCALALIAAFAHAQSAEPPGQKEPLNTAMQSESCLHERSYCDASTLQDDLLLLQWSERTTAATEPAAQSNGLILMVEL